MLQILLVLSLSILSLPILSSTQDTPTLFQSSDADDLEYDDDDNSYDEADSYDDDDNYDEDNSYSDDNYEENNNTPEDNLLPSSTLLEPLEISPSYNTNTNPTFYMPPYKTFDFKNLKTKKVPKLLSSEGMLKNLDKSYWLLKFYGHPDITSYKYIEISIEDSQMNIQLLDYKDEVVENNTHRLTPIKMFKPNEGIFAYPDKDGNLYFVYLNLLLPHLLAMKMTSSFEEAEQMSKKSLTEFGIFVLR